MSDGIARYLAVWHVIEAGGVGAWLRSMGLLLTAELLRQAGRKDDGADRFSRINTGSTLHGGGRARRDKSTFLAITDYRASAVAELSIRARSRPTLPGRP